MSSQSAIRPEKRKANIGAHSKVKTIVTIRMVFTTCFSTVLRLVWRVISLFRLLIVANIVV